MNLLTALQHKGNTHSEALEIIEYMKDEVFNNGADPEELLYQEGLEPDYVFDILD